MPDLTRPSRKGKEREQNRDPVPTDLAEKFIAHQRRTAASTKPKDRSERAIPPTLPATSVSPRRPHATPTLGPPASNNTQDADPEEFSRRLKISNSPHPSPRPHQKLYNPNTDTTPMRHNQDSEPFLERGQSHLSPRPAILSRAQQHSPQRENAQQRQLFDHRKDDPVRFSNMARPANGASQTAKPPTPSPRSSVDYVSASSTSSYAQSTLSSNFTLSTDGSSASSALFDGKPRSETTGTVLSAQLKRLYRDISVLEGKVSREDNDEALDEPRIMLKGKERKDDDSERDRWKRVLEDHKNLADMIHNLLQLTLAHNVPVSLRSVPDKYNLIMRLWLNGFHRPLENLRRCAFNNSVVALEHLQDFIYYAYTFYSCLYEEENLLVYRSSWVESLGDLARYRMAVSELVTSKTSHSTSLTQSAVSQVPGISDDVAMSTTVDDTKVSQISDNPVLPKGNSPSVGIEAARAMELPPEREKWRNIAREWYSNGLIEYPGTGRLHHHMGFLCKEFGEGEELRGLYHFIKSMTTLQPFTTARESILALWSPSAQLRRSSPEAHVSDLFILLHGMLFTNIQRDDFQSTLSRLLERLQIEEIEERDWMMMAVVNIGSILEYGRPTAVLKQISGIVPAIPPLPKSRASSKKEERRDSDRMDIDAEEEDIKMLAADGVTSPVIVKADVDLDGDLPMHLRLSLQLTFFMLSQALSRPMRTIPFQKDTLNPYITIILTFVSTVVKSDHWSIFERVIPWGELASFLSTIPRSVIKLSDEAAGLREPSIITAGCTPLPEDACLRGMAWGGRKIYERGFWNRATNGRVNEAAVLDVKEGEEVSDGIIEDDDDDDDGKGNPRDISDQDNRWIRVLRSGTRITKYVDGFVCAQQPNGKRIWSVGGRLADKVEGWKEQRRREREEEEMRRIRRRWDDSMDVDEEPAEDASEESDVENENDNEEVKALKERRRYLRSILQSANDKLHTAPPPSRRTPRAKRSTSKPTNVIVPGYTVLVIDTNILLSSLSMFTSLVESLRWTVIVPLPVIMELDGLAASDSPQLAEASRAALSFLSSSVKTLSTSLKVQTSRGNYLSSLNVRTEQVDFGDRDSWERNMDDLILRAAIWHDEHWFDRSGLLKPSETTPDLKNAAKVVLLSLDRNLRLKARSRHLAAASQSDLAAILATVR